jgi:carbon-monoxide dehydrogenase small subunit
MIMSTSALVAANPNMSEDDIRHNLEGNMCRCTGYHNIVKAVKQVAGGGD